MKNATWYLYVNALSSLGSRMDLIACSALIFTFEHSAYWLTAFFVARQVGGILFSLVAGILADRVDRRWAMLASDVGAGLAILSIVLFPHPYVVVAAAFVKGMLYSLFHISFQSSLPQIFGGADLVKINGLTVRLESIVGIAGFALGGYLTDQFGYSFVIACDAATFFLSALALTRLRWESRALPPKKSIVSERKGSAFAYLLRYPVFMVICVLALFESISTAAHNYGLPFLAEQLVAGDATLHGFMWSTMSVGALAGSYLASHWREKLMRAVFAASFLTALVVTLAFAAKQLGIVLLLLAGAGLFTGAAQVFKSTILQQAENHIRGRVMGIQGFLSRIGFFFGFVSAPHLAASFDLFGMVFCAQALFATGLIALGCFFKIRGKEESY
jgi:MFS family permease